MQHSTLRSSLVPFVLGLGLAAGSLGAQFGVAALSPANNEVSAPTTTPVVVRFSAPVARATVDLGSFRVFGKWSGVVPGTFFFTDQDRSVTFTPARPFFPGESVHLILASSITDAGGAPLARGYSAWFWIRSARGSNQFTRVRTWPVRLPGETSRIRTYGAYAGDLDGDGAPDLSLPNEDSDDVRTMLNDGCGTFALPVVHGLPSGSVPSPIEGQDLDGDGDIDIAVANTRGNSFSVLLGDGAGGFAPAVSYTTATQTRGLTLLDADGDGDVDVVTAHRQTGNLALFRNDGAGNFGTAAFFQGGGSGETAVMAADANGDGLSDLFVGNFSSSTVTLLLGDGTGNFTLSATRSVGSGPWMIVVGDVDGDGHADAAVCSSSGGTVSIVRGDGAGGLAPATSFRTGSFPLAVDLGDIDGDGDLDCSVSNFRSADYTVLMNDGTGALGSPRTLTTTAAGSCMLIVDYDRDGDMDLLAVDELDDLVHVFEQDGPNPASTQPPACNATLRVDNFGNRAGFGSAAPHPVNVGSGAYLGVTGKPNQLWLLLLGLPDPIGSLTPYGRLNLSSTVPIPPPLFQTDAAGEGRLTFPIPLGLPTGLTVGFQALVADPATVLGARLSNAETILTQ